MTPAFTFPDSLVIHIHSKDLFVVLLNQFMPYARGPIDYGQTMNISNDSLRLWILRSPSSNYRKDIAEELTRLYQNLPDKRNTQLIFILQEYSESS